MCCKITTPGSGNAHKPAPSVWYVWIVRPPNAAMVPNNLNVSAKLGHYGAPMLTLDESTFIEGISVYIDLDLCRQRGGRIVITEATRLNVVFVSHIEGADDSRRCCSPILVQLQSSCTSLDDLLECCRSRIVALTSERKVHWHPVRGREHLTHVERARRACRRIRASRRACTATDHGRRARRERLRDLLRADVVAVRVDGSCCDDQLLARDGLGGGADDEVRVHPIHDVRITRLPDADDDAVADADISLVTYSPVINVL